MEMTVILVLLLASIGLLSVECVIAQPVSDGKRSNKSTQVHNFKAMKSMLDAANVAFPNSDKSVETKVRKNQTIPKRNLPPSPVGLLRPDLFQFYTFNQNGDVITNQMSKKDIQSLIASSGEQIPIKIYESQMVTDAPPGETNVADVVQNVQNVLKAELSKPPLIMTSMPTIPGHENSDWSNILPSILAADTDTNVTNKPEFPHGSDVAEVNVARPIFNTGSETFGAMISETYDTKPMIPVAMITAGNQSPIQSGKNEIPSVPVFHILNMITTDKENFTHVPNDASITILNSDARPGVAVTIKPCSPITTDCSNHDLINQKIPIDTLTNHDGSMGKNENETTNEINPGYHTTVQVNLDEDIINPTQENAKPLIPTNGIDPQYTTQNSLQTSSIKEKIKESMRNESSLHSDESDAKLNPSTAFNSIEKPQSIQKNEESNVSQLNTQKLFTNDKIDEVEATTSVLESPSTSHQVQSSNNGMVIIKLNSEPHQITHVPTERISVTQTTHPVINHQYKTHHERFGIVPNEEPSLSNHGETPSTLSNYMLDNSSSVTPLDHPHPTISVNITNSDKTYPTTGNHIAHTTIVPILHEKHTPVNRDGAITRITNILNSSDVISSHEVYPQLTTPTPIVLEGPNVASSSTETISTELADSLSSMISQISIVKPFLVPSSDDIHTFKNSTNTSDFDEIIPYTTKNHTKKNATNISAMHNRTEADYNVHITKNMTGVFEDAHNNSIKISESNDSQDAVRMGIAEKILETPIVRIDIVGTMPNHDMNPNITLVNNDNHNYHDDEVNTESPMVRIKLTDPITTLNHILESSPVQVTITNNIENLTLPTERNVPANGIGSGLIAGFHLDSNESTSLQYSGLISDADTDKMMSNETSGNIGSTTQKSVQSKNTTTFPTTIETHTQSADMTHITSHDALAVNKVPTNDVSYSTESTVVTKYSTCFPQNSSFEYTNYGDSSLCSISTGTSSDHKKATTNAAEDSIIQPLLSSLLPPYISTISYITKESINQEMITQGTMITNPEEKTVDHSMGTVIAVMTDKTQLNEQLSLTDENATISNTFQSQSVNEHDLENVNFTKHNLSIMSPNKLKDKKTDGLRTETLKIVTTERIAAIPVELNNTPSSIQKSTIMKKLNSTQGGKVPEKWTLIPQKNHFITQRNDSALTNPLEHRIAVEEKGTDQPLQTTVSNEPKGALGLDSSVEKLDADISYFSIVCNDLAFKYWSAVTSGLSASRSIALSPFGMTSILAMLFLGARSSTSDRMNEILKLDDVTSFNPHLVFQNITDSVSIAQNQGIANVAFVRELFTDQSKIRKLMRFYKKQVEQFYDGMVEQVNFSTISDAVRRKTNFLIRKQTGGRIRNFIKTNTVPLRSPLAALSANIFQTDCNLNDATSRGRDGELYFAVSPAVRQRKLVLVPAILWKAGVLAGYEPSLDATAYAIGGIDKIVSTIFVVPGQQGSTASDDNLDALEQRIIPGVLHDAAWNKLLKVIVPRTGLELQIPKFSHTSIINATAALKIVGLENLFLKCADFKGINGVGNDFHLADVIQMNMFSTCGDENIQSGKTRHHVEIYPASPQRNTRRSKYDDNDNADNDGYDKNRSGESEHLEGMGTSSTTTTTKTKTDEKPRVKLDKPFLYFVRHNPTGLILFMGRFNPRLLP